MRLLPLLLLFGCFDAASTTVTLDLSAGMAAVKQQLHNAWPDTVGCDELAQDDVPGCVAAIRSYLDTSRKDLAEKGATGVTSGIVLADGKLDVRYDFTAPVGSDALNDNGLSFLYLEERTQGQVKSGKAGKRRVAMLAAPGESGSHTQKVEGKYRLLATTAGEPFSLHVFSGKSATVLSEWVYTPGPDDEASPGAWLRERPGLEDALKTSGLVVSPG